MAATNISQFRARDMTAAWRHIDYLLILAMVVLSLFGLALVHSASRFFPEGSFMPRQGLFLIVGTGVTVLFAAVDFTWWTKYSPAFYAGGVALLIAVLAFGAVVNSTKGWFDLGFFQLQPAEPVKLAVILVAARFLGREDISRGAMTLGAALVIFGLPMGLIMLQPDLGSVLVYLLIGAGMFFAGGIKGVPLVNPISAELAVMRQTLWPGLINTVRHNLARQQSRVRLFEAGARFSPAGADGLSEQNVIAGVAIGNVVPEQWDTKPASAGFFDVKADVEAVLRLAGDPSSLSFVSAEHPALQPGQTARILRDGVPAGWLGVLHPALRAVLELPASLVLFEIDTAALGSAKPRRYRGLSRFPAVRRDLAILVASEVPAGKLLAAVAEAAGPTLKDVVVFDIFTDSRIGSGQKSVALGLILQETSRTLTDADIEKIVSGVVTHLAMKFDARLRE